MPDYIRTIATNASELYQKLFEDRGIRSGEITQYKTRIFGSRIKSLNIATTKHTWSMGDKLFKLSYQYYNTYELWWVIALWNGKPTDAHYDYGDVIEIPTNPQTIVTETT